MRSTGADAGNLIRQAPASDPEGDNIMPVKVPTTSEATDDAGSGARHMVEGAVTAAGYEVGGAIIPVAGEAAGGYLASLMLKNGDAQTYARRRAGEEAAVRLLM